MTQKISIIGAPVQTGTGRGGCLMGPAALRTAGIAGTFMSLGRQVADQGDLVPDDTLLLNPVPDHISAPEETLGWITAIHRAVLKTAKSGAFPVTIGGDHSLAAGTMGAMAEYAAEKGQPLFVLWFDAHPDLHSIDTTESGNLHGCPMGYVTGQPGFEAFPKLKATIPPNQVCMIGLRSVDPEERQRLANQPFHVSDMRALDEHGIASPLRSFLELVKAADGLLHVSFDVDFLDPDIAPGVGTTVPGGATFREAHLAMEMLCDSGLVSSLDLVELNPFLDERGRTAQLLVDLVASLFGRRVLDRPTMGFAA